MDEVRPDMFNALCKGILWLNRMSSDMAFRKGTERLANFGDHHNTLEGKQERMHFLTTGTSLYLASLLEKPANCLKKNVRLVSTSSAWPSDYRPNIHSSVNARETLGGMPKLSAHILYDSRKCSPLTNQTTVDVKS